MPDFPNANTTLPSGTIFVGSAVSLGIMARSGGSYSSAVWPAANRAIYIPFYLEQTLTVYQIAFEVGTQSGNLDVGIYDINQNRLVSSGSTAMGAAGIQLVDIADTTLGPGTYFMAMNVDNGTAAIIRSSAQALLLQVLGVQQQAVGAVTLPNPATFANPASAYVPGISLATKSTI